ncbi:MAG: imelysin family protein [Bacteroidota bacterium]
MKHVIVLPALFLFLLASSGCTDQEERLLSVRADQLADVYTYGAKPAHESFTGYAKALYESVNKLAQNPTEQTLSEAQDLWLKATIAYKRCELYNIGAVERTYLSHRVHRWPADTSAIYKFVYESDYFDMDAVERAGTYAVGLAAIEYLLFGADSEATLKVIEDYEDPTSNFLLLLTVHLYEVAEELEQAWINFSEDFIESTDLGVFGSQNQLINSMVFHLKESVRYRLGKPLGEATGGNVQTDLAETPYAHVSLLTLKAGLLEFERILSGNYGDQTEGIGYYDYLTEIGEEAIVPRLKESVNSVKNQINEMAGLSPDGNLAFLLVDYPSSVESLKTKMMDLLTLVKVDLISLIGATVTINDTDAD